MGLSEGKRKVKTGLDPRNTVWSRDENKYGHQMLLKMGWTPESGLGKEGHGVKTHLTLKKRAGNVGIGGDRRKEDEWTSAGGDAYEKILKALNERAREKQEAAAVQDLAPTPQAAVEGKRQHRLAHRSRHLAAKRAINSSQSAMNEVLGIRASASTADVPSSVGSGEKRKRTEDEGAQPRGDQGSVHAPHLAHLPVAPPMPKPSHEVFARGSRSPSPSPPPAPARAELGSIKMTRSEETVWEYFARRMQERRDRLASLRSAPIGQDLNGNVLSSGESKKEKMSKRSKGEKKKSRDPDKEARRARKAERRRARLEHAS